MFPNARPDHLGSGVPGYLDSGLGMVHPMGGDHDTGRLPTGIPYSGVAGGARCHTCGYTDTGSLMGMGGLGGISSMGEMSGAQGMTGDHGAFYDRVDARSESVRRGGKRSGEPSLRSMINASPEEFQRMCEASDRAGSTEFVAARRRSMLGAEIRGRRTCGETDASISGNLAGMMDDGMHAGVGRGVGNYNTYPEFCDQGFDTNGPFIDRSSYGEFGRPFCSRDGHASLLGQRGGMDGSVGNGPSYGGFDDGGLDTKGPFLSTRSSGGLSGTFSPGSSRAAPSGQSLLDVITEHQGRKRGDSGVVGRYL